MKMYISNKKKIGVIEMKNDVSINFTSDDPIKWIMVSAKVETKQGIVETVRDLVSPGRLKSGVKKEIKKQMDKKELDEVSKLIKKYVKNKVLPQEAVHQIYEEI